MNVKSKELDKIAVQACNAGFAEGMLVLTEMHDKMPKVVKESVEGKLSKETIDALEWARDFMRNYERKNGS